MTSKPSIAAPSAASLSAAALRRSLCAAIALDDAEAALRLVEKGANPNAVRPASADGADGVDYEETVTALALAAQFDRQRCLKALIPFSKLDAVGKDGRSAISHAAIHGHAACVQILLDAGASVSPAGAKTSLLCDAVEQERLDVVELLLPRCDARAATRHGRTPLHLAIANRDANLARKLLPLSDARQRDFFERDALMIAIDRGLEELVPDLLRVCDALVVDKKRLTPLMLAAALGEIASARLLLPRSDLEARDEHGRRALDLAAESGHAALVALLAPVSRPNVRDNEGRDALMRAALSNLACVDLLLPFFNPKNLNDGGWSALAIAASGGRVAIVKRLLPLSDAGARMGKSRRGARVEEVALRNGHAEVAALVRAEREAQALRAALAKTPKPRRKDQNATEEPLRAEPEAGATDLAAPPHPTRRPRSL
jgi:ankyrin repeat protein